MSSKKCYSAPSILVIEIDEADLIADSIPVVENPGLPDTSNPGSVIEESTVGGYTPSFDIKEHAWEEW